MTVAPSTADAASTAMDPTNEAGGCLPSQPSATAAAVSALVMAEQYGYATLSSTQVDLLDSAYRGDLSELVLASICWLAERQNKDGGFGGPGIDESDKLTSLLVLSAFRLTCVPAEFADLDPRLEAYLRKSGGVVALRKSALDRPTLIGALTNAGLAGVIPWKQIPITRFERAAAPAVLRGLLGAPQFDASDPVLLAAGMGRFHQGKPSNPLLQWARRVSADRCLKLIAERQSPDGSFVESTLATSFVTMSLAAAGKASHPIVRRAVESLLCNVRTDASWAP